VTETGLDELSLLAASTPLLSTVIPLNLREAVGPQYVDAGDEGDSSEPKAKGPLFVGALLRRWRAIANAAPGLENLTNGDDTMTMLSPSLCCAPLNGLEDDTASEAPAYKSTGQLKSRAIH